MLDNNPFFESNYNAEIYKKIMKYSSFRFRIAFSGNFVNLYLRIKRGLK